MRTMLRLFVLPVTLLLVAAGCGSSDQQVRSDPTTTTDPTGSTGQPPTDPPPGRHQVPTGADEVVVRVTDCCGFVPTEISLASVPSLSIMGDGTVITTGPVTMQYPPKALPNLQRGSASPQAVDALIARAGEAGLLETGIDFGQPGVTDMATTTLTLVFGGKAHEISAYALGMGLPDDVAGGLTATQQARRKALSDLIAAAQRLGGDSRPYEPEAVTVFALPVPENGGVEGGVAPGQAVWPLDDPSAWKTTASSAGAGCRTYTGANAATALEAAKDAASTTEWSLGSTTPTTGPAGNTTGSAPVRLVFRPLLPDEKDACTPG